MSQKAKVLLAFTGVFVAGAIAGGIAGLRMEKERAAAAATEKAAANLSPQLLKQLTSQLDLTESQKQKVTPIIDQSAEKIAALNQDYREATQDYREAFMALREDMEKEVADLLGAEQRKKLEAAQARWKQQFNTRYNRPPSPPGGLGQPADRLGRGNWRGPGSADPGSNSNPFLGRGPRRLGGPPPNATTSKSSADQSPPQPAPSAPVKANP